MSKPNIILLRGIYIMNVEPKLVKNNEKMMQSINNNDSNKIVLSNTVYDKIPKKYDKSTWIKNTNLKCWKCDLYFNTIPYFIATKSIHDPTGNFCSPGCTKLFIETEADATYKWEMEMQLKFLHEELTNQSNFTILAAPSKTRRQEYGGDLTEEQFVNLVRSCVILNKN